MKIFGIGTDIIKTSRIKNSIKNKLFLNKIYNIEEVLRCNKTRNRSNCFAKRFAAKEAFSKALGTGIAKGLSFNEIVILNKKNGKPFIKLLNKTKKFVDNKLKKKKYKIFLSITDEKNYAVAFVTISI
tara:strand:- start:89 stop:472 length:384 start_codon:yes stop_codon:yes gene_type:complete